MKSTLLSEQRRITYIFHLVQVLVANNSISLHAVNDLLASAVLLVVAILDKHGNKLITALVSDNGMHLLCKKRYLNEFNLTIHSAKASIKINHESSVSLHA